MCKLDIFLKQNPPETIVDTFDLSEIEEMLCSALAQREVLTEGAIHSLKYVLPYWVLSALSRPSDLETVLLCDRVCSGVSQLVPLSANIFDVYRDLLEIKRQDIARLKSGRCPRQSKKILTILDGQERDLGYLMDKLQISKGRLYQVLAVMEVCRLVKIRRLSDISLRISPVQTFNVGV